MKSIYSTNLIPLLFKKKAETENLDLDMFYSYLLLRICITSNI
ncbi:hypothetical protein SPHINGO8BC_51455 [Sphingobacterium multivorum]|uniref:Uncharacterized protein n=1 Tax=Sphingobacterium multivorum TaxID=28454 RepID=A0A654D1X1_SPHMU|nr:hypothetical protein SPHINGO8BC_51455 [Sphingobacterium multivorum]